MKLEERERKSRRKREEMNCRMKGCSQDHVVTLSAVSCDSGWVIEAREGGE